MSHMETLPRSSLPTTYHHSPYPAGFDMDQKQQLSATNGASSALASTGAGPVEPPVYTATRGNYEYSLVIDQQPVRARMCGFGDKDRRPITPPPCVRIVVTDLTTGMEVPADDIESSFFLLSVDLWDENATQEKNIVRSSNTSPAVSISTATTTSFPIPPERPIYTPGVMYQSGYGAPGYGQAPVYPQPQAHGGMYPSAGAYYGAPGYPPQYGQHPSQAGYGHPQYGQPQVPYSPSSQSAPGMYTRNLIGSLAVNAFQLEDIKGKKGHWFILQDLSVRTEGTFRLKLSFIDVGTHQSPTGKEENKLHCGKTSVLASVFSQPFQVFSAKKFPGVIESTALSKCFSTQGIKIPIRKDTKGDGGDGGDD